MAQRRMFSRQITESDAFMDMPLSAQALYFHIAMNADDDGFVNNPKRVQRVIGANDDDLKLLIAKRFLLKFDSGVVVVKHWKMHNYIPKDRYKPTDYTEEKALLYVKPNRSYTFCIHPVYKLDTQNSIDKNRLDKNSIDKGCSRSDRINLLMKLSDEETARLFDIYEDADYLIDEVEAEINAKMKGDEIENFYRYIIGYATNKGWVTR